MRSRHRSVRPQSDVEDTRVVDVSAPRGSRVIVAVGACAIALPSRAWALDLQQSAGTVTGVVADETGAPIVQATVTLTTDGGEPVHGTTAADGRFSLAAVPAGSFQLTIAAHGFA